MANAATQTRVPVEKLRWRLDPAALSFETTDDLEPLKEIVGQKRGVEAFRFGMNMDKPGYNVLVTGRPGTGRLETVKKLLEDLSRKVQAPDDLCYVNNFKNPDAPILLRFKAGVGAQFKKDMHDFVETMKRDVPQLFESQEYINRKKEIMETYEERTKEFFKGLDKKVKDMGFTLAQMQGEGEGQRPPVLMPVVDGEPMPLSRLENMVEKGRFPEKEFTEIKEKYNSLKTEIDQIFLEIRELQKGLQEKGRKFDETMFRNLATEKIQPLSQKYDEKPVRSFLEAALESMAEEIEIFQPQQLMPGMPPGLMMAPMGDRFQPYQVNLLVDNADQKSPPVLVESYPTYRNLFGGIERVVDRSGVWRTDYSKILAGSFLKANGGYLVLNLMDVLMEPGVWPTLKRSLKTLKVEIQTFDPFYWFTSAGLKPQSIEIDVKVIILSDPYYYQMLRHFDEDVPKIFKVRADFDQSMDRTEEAIAQFARLVRAKTGQEGIRPFDRSGVGALLEHAVRMTGRQEKISSSLPELSDLVSEASYWAGQDGSDVVKEKHVDEAVGSRIYRSNMMEEKMQEMVERGSLLIDTAGAVVGQVNGLAVIGMGDYMFGRPTRITASTAMGKDGVINIEREADMSGNIHNKGVLILSGYLRRKFAQDKPLSVSASIAFEQSYSGIDGDSASSTELYALLSSLAEVPIKQNIAVTGSVNQKGEVQAIGGVNEKIEGFFDTCAKAALTGDQGVMIPESNVKDLMLRKDVVKAVEEGRFHIWAVKDIDQGIEILTGIPAGERDGGGTYPEGTIHGQVDKKLLQLAERIMRFGKNEQGKKRGKKGAKKEEEKKEALI
jgi:lon-related putative ATP-dependent protease